MKNWIPKYRLPSGPLTSSRPVTSSRAISSLGLLALLFVAGLLWGCDDGRTPVVLYSPHGRDLLTLVETTFEAQNPEIDVRWLDMGSQEVFDRVRSETANPQCDVWFGGPAAILDMAAEAGLLTPFRPTWADAVPERSQHPENLFFGLYRTLPLLVYNEDALSPDEAPSDWDALLEPRWQDKILIREPLASGTMRTIFGMMLAQSVSRTGATDEGFDWLRRLDAQTKEYVHNPALLHQKMIRQEGLVTMWTLTDILLQRQRGAPLGYRFPKSGTPVIDDSIALVKGARHAEAAQTFIEWIGSREAQLLTAEKALFLPARDDLPAEDLPEWARQALAEMVPADVDWSLIEERGAAWMDAWDREVRGKGKAAD